MDATVRIDRVFLRKRFFRTSGRNFTSHLLRGEGSLDEESLCQRYSRTMPEGSPTPILRDPAAASAKGTDVLVARRTIVAMLRSGAVVNGFSLVILGGAVFTATASPWRESKACAALFGASVAGALAQAYFAVRVRIDADVLGFLDSRGEGASEDEVGREAGVDAVRAAVPGGLAARMGKVNLADPLDAHRRSLKLFFRQAAWAVLQTILYGAAFAVGLP
jgi:hypothetical protein